MKKYLIIVDVQNDFCLGGKLAVKYGDRIIPNINKLTRSGKFDRIIATQDWHPKDHVSFYTWPEHCVQGTEGAEFSSSLDQGQIQFIVRKGFNPDMDSHSGFFENDNKTPIGLSDLIDGRRNEVYIVGIATEICVLKTALDAVNNHFYDTFVIEDACAGITDEVSKVAIETMRAVGIKIIKTKDIIGEIKDA